MEDKLLYRDEVYAIQGALFDVYKTMGNMWGEVARFALCFVGERPLPQAERPRTMLRFASCDLVSNHVVFSCLFV